MIKTKIIFNIFCAIFLLLASCYKETNLVSDQIYKIDKITSIQTLFESIARQPEIAVDLIQTTENIAGYRDISELAPIDESISKKFGYARGVCISACAESIARQPESHAILTATAVKFLGAYNGTGITAQINEYSKVRALPGILGGISRQPDAFNSINEMSKALLGVELTKE